MQSIMSGMVDGIEMPFLATSATVLRAGSALMKEMSKSACLKKIPHSMSWKAPAYWVLCL